MERIRLAELLGSLSFAGDLGRGQPMGHVLRTTRIAMALAGRLGVPSENLADVYFTSLLLHAGCTAGLAEFAAFLASDCEDIRIEQPRWVVAANANGIIAEGSQERQESGIDTLVE